MPAGGAPPALPTFGSLHPGQPGSGQSQVGQLNSTLRKSNSSVRSARPFVCAFVAGRVSGQVGQLSPARPSPAAQLCCTVSAHADSPPSTCTPVPLSHEPGALSGRQHSTRPEDRLEQQVQTLAIEMREARSISQEQGRQKEQLQVCTVMQESCHILLRW